MHCKEDTKNTEHQQFSLLDRWLSSKDAANFLNDKVQVTDSSDKLRKIFEEELVGNLEPGISAKGTKRMDTENKETDQQDMDTDIAPIVDDAAFEIRTSPNLWINKPLAMTINTDDDTMLP